MPTGPCLLPLRALVFYACGPFFMHAYGPSLLLLFIRCIDCIADMLSLLSRNTARHLVPIQIPYFRTGMIKE